MNEQERWHQWRSAVVRPEVDVALVDLYESIGEQVRRRGPVCWASGRCCAFDTFRGDGHKLYVTGLEIAWVLHRLEGGDSTTPSTPIDLNGPCPYQAGGLCTIRSVRPMGCRVFFCQRGTEGWQNELYENMLARLKDLHAALGLPYQYMEWRSGLSDARLAIR